MPGALTFPINVERVESGVAVSDAEVGAAMRAAFLHLKLVVEPGGAVGLAALLSGKIATAGRTVVAVLSGGNVDPAVFRAVLNQGDDPAVAYTRSRRASSLARCWRCCSRYRSCTAAARR